jgi:hypothetical protein
MREEEKNEQGRKELEKKGERRRRKGGHLRKNISDRRY